jgi:hypothetical protein
MAYSELVVVIMPGLTVPALEHTPPVIRVHLSVDMLAFGLMVIKQSRAALASLPCREQRRRRE